MINNLKLKKLLLTYEQIAQLKLDSDDELFLMLVANELIKQEL